MKPNGDKTDFQKNGLKKKKHFFFLSKFDKNDLTHFC